MMRRCFVMLLAVAAAIVLVPELGSAQARGKGPAWAAGGPPAKHWGRDREDRRARDRRDGRWDRDRDRDHREWRRDGGDRDDWGRDWDDRDDWEWGRDRDGRWGRRARARGRGPAFCRSGAGHPVHGRRWCLQKGFGLGGLSLEDIIFRAQRRDRSNASVIDILEDVLDGRDRR